MGRIKFRSRRIAYLPRNEPTQEPPQTLKEILLGFYRDHIQSPTDFFLATIPAKISYLLRFRYYRYLKDVIEESQGKLLEQTLTELKELFATTILEPAQELNPMKSRSDELAIAIERTQSILKNLIENNIALGHKNHLKPSSPIIEDFNTEVAKWKQELESQSKTASKFEKEKIAIEQKRELLGFSQRALTCAQPPKLLPKTIIPHQSTHSSPPGFPFRVALSKQNPRFQCSRAPTHFFAATHR